MKKINLEELRLATREEIGTDAAYLAGDYHESTMYICDAIAERADSDTSIYYSDITKFISEHVDEVSETIKEFGWNEVGGDLYKAGQFTEYLKIQREYTEQIDGIIRYAAIMGLIYTHKLDTITGETWEEIERELEELDENSRFDEIADVVTEALAEEA